MNDTIQITLSGHVETTLVQKDESDTWTVSINSHANFNDMSNTPPGEEGWLGNPYRPHDDGLRGDHIERFRKAFIKKLETDDEFCAAVDDLDGETLGCCCGRDRCHGEVIVEYLNNGLEAIKQAGEAGDEENE